MALLGISREEEEALESLMPILEGMLREVQDLTRRLRLIETPPTMSTTLARKTVAERHEPVCGQTYSSQPGPLFRCRLGQTARGHPYCRPPSMHSRLCSALSDHHQLSSRPAVQQQHGTPLLVPRSNVWPGARGGDRYNRMT
jgi:hypothetical protein